MIASVPNKECRCESSDGYSISPATQAAADYHRTDKYHLNSFWCLMQASDGFDPRQFISLAGVGGRQLAAGLLL